MEAAYAYFNKGVLKQAKQVQKVESKIKDL
jgi:hypothetical protein